jgi:hypothetical protein
VRAERLDELAHRLGDNRRRWGFGEAEEVMTLGGVEAQAHQRDGVDAPFRRARGEALVARAVVIQGIHTIVDVCQHHRLGVAVDARRCRRHVRPCEREDLRRRVGPQDGDKVGGGDRDRGQRPRGGDLDAHGLTGTAGTHTGMPCPGGKRHSHPFTSPRT